MKLKITKGKVEAITHFTASYVSKVIRSGTLDTVYIPYFGSFQAKLNQVGIVDTKRGRVPIIINEEDDDDVI